MSDFESPRKGSQAGMLVKNMIYPVVKPISIEITNELNTLQLETIC